MLLGKRLHRHVLTVTGLSPSPAPPSKGLHLHTHFLTAHQAGRPSTAAPTTPQMQPLPGITHLRFSLIRFRSPLLSESQLFSLPMGTEMFHFPTFPPHALYIQAQVTGHDSSWVSPFGHPRITARLPTPQGLSQAPTSFIGSRCQGIHHVPFTACHHQHHTTPTSPEEPPSTARHRRLTRHKRNSHNNPTPTTPAPPPPPLSRVTLPSHSLESLSRSHSLESLSGVTLEEQGAATPPAQVSGRHAQIQNPPTTITVGG